jgi:hypothetical protein
MKWLNLLCVLPEISKSSQLQFVSMLLTIIKINHLPSAYLYRFNSMANARQINRKGIW